MERSSQLVKPLKAIFFDLDGTLIDTEPSAALAIRAVFAAWGIRLKEKEDAEFITGRTWASASDYLFKKYPLPVSREEAARILIGRYQEEIKRELHLVPGGVNAVRALSRHYPLALVSGSNRREIVWALDQLGIQHLFRVILGAEDYAQSKPAPDGYLKGLSLLHCAGHEALVFEDSQAGIASAKAAGLRVVAISGTNHYNQDTSGADIHIPDLRGINGAWVEKCAFAEKLPKV